MDVIVEMRAVMIDLALAPGEYPLLFVLTRIGGLSDVGVDSVELLIGDSDGT